MAGPPLPQSIPPADFTKALHKTLNPIYRRLLPSPAHGGELFSQLFLRLLQREVEEESIQMILIPLQELSNSKRCMLRKSLGQVLNKDFIKCHMSSHMMSLLKSIEKSDSNSQPSKVVSNIPFNTSTNIIKQLLPMGDVFSEVLLLQILISNSESQGHIFPRPDVSN